MPQQPASRSVTFAEGTRDSSALAGAGLVSGGGMGREAALGKLFGLLGADLAAAEVERLFTLDLCGELAE